MPFFYPFGRLFDPTVGGDTPISLGVELALGFVGGVLLTPVAALVGAAVGFILNGRRIGPVIGLVLIASASALPVCLLVALNGGFVDENVSLRSLQWVAALGALGGTVAVAFYSLARQRVIPKLGSAGIP